MNPDEYERLKEAEKAHLKKVRELKQQLREAQRKERVTEALNQLDTRALDDEFEQSLRAVQEKSLSAEARFEIAMDALDEADKRERARLETEKFEAERKSAEAAELVRRMKAEMDQQGEPPITAQASSQATHGASSADVDPTQPRPSGTADSPEQPPPKTIGRRSRRSD